MADAQPKWLQKLVTVKHKTRGVEYLLFGRVIQDKSGLAKKKRTKNGMVEMQYSDNESGWYWPSSLGDGSAHEQAFNAAQGRGELYRLEVEREESSSDESSSDDDSAASSEPDLSNVVLDDVPLAASVKKKYEIEIKLCVHYEVDFSQFQGKAASSFRTSDFTKAWKRAKGVESEPNHKT